MGADPREGANLREGSKPNKYGNLICAVSYWELMVGVALHLSKSTPRSNANEKGIDFLIAQLIPTLG